MKKITLLLLMLFSISLLWSQGLESVFKAMPFDIVPGITSDDKDIMLVDTGKVSVPTPLGEVTKIYHTDKSISLTTSTIGSTDIHILSKNDGSELILVIKSVRGSIDDSALDSNLKIYTTDWQELESEGIIPIVTMQSFIDIEGIKNSLSSDLILPVYCPIAAEYDVESGNLVLSVDTESLFGKDILSSMKQFIITDNVVLKWNGASFN